jgi:hypothetical protein
MKKYTGIQILDKLSEKRMKGKAHSCPSFWMEFPGHGTGRRRPTQLSGGDRAVNFRGQDSQNM